MPKDPPAGVKVFVATFAHENEADDALQTLRRLATDDDLEVVDAAVVVRGADGQVELREAAEPSGRKWAKRGAVAGGLVGLVFPPSILVSAALGASGAGLWGRLRDKGFDDSELRRVGESLPAGGSALVAIADDQAWDRLQRALSTYQGLAASPLTPEAAAVVLQPGDPSETDPTREDPLTST